MAENRLELLDLIGEPSRQFAHFCKQDDGHPHLLLSLMGYNLVYFQGRVYPHKQGEGAFAPDEGHSGYTSVLEACADVLEQAGEPEMQAFGYAVNRTDNGYQAVSVTDRVEAESIPSLVEALRNRWDAILYTYNHGKDNFRLFDLIGEPTRQYAYLRKQGDEEPRSLLSLMGYNLVCFQGRVYPHKQGDGAFEPGESHGHGSVLEACAEVLEQVGQSGLPEILAFGHVIRRTDNGFQAVSGAESLESESLVALVRELKRRRDENLQIYLHVGMPKTATTFLQRHVFPKIPGVHYVEWDTEFFAHEFQRIKYGCPFSYIDEIHQGFEVYLESFDEEKLLISDEAITGPGNRAKDIGTLVIVIREVFPSAQILLVLREQCSFLRSFYLHRLREGDTRSAANFVRYSSEERGFIKFDLDIYRAQLDVKFFEYKALVWLLRKEFSSVQVMLYEQLKFNPQEFASGLSAWLGTQVVLEGVSQNQENVRLGLVGAMFLKVFNRLTVRWGWIRHQSRLARIANWVNRLDAKFHIPYDPFPPWLQAAIRQRYAVTNKELGEMIGLDVERYWGKPEKAANQ